jgi:hypothetical protein
MSDLNEASGTIMKSPSIPACRDPGVITGGRNNPAGVSLVSAMKRRRILSTVASLYGAQVLLRQDVQTAEPKSEGGLHDPYADVDWDKCNYLHSMSHQHTGQTAASCEEFYAMGYRHFAFSNYYPSAPTYPLPQAFLAKHADVIAAPNAEQHSMPDAGLHFNSLGSLLATGYGSSLSAAQLRTAPLVHQFDGLQVFNEARPWTGVYRLDLTLTAIAEGGLATLTVEGATECEFTGKFAAKALVHDRPLKAGSHTIYFRTTEPHLHIQLVYDKQQLTVAQCRLMQGTNRPWREVFRAALDGETIEGRRTVGLLHADGGGITLNHPTQDRKLYAMFLDFDPRVLGIEVWNQLTSGFGSSKGFYDDSEGPHLHFYQLWDDLLRTGRRCWGFFVKDHNTFGRGRNVLLVPNTQPMRKWRLCGPTERELFSERCLPWRSTTRGQWWHLMITVPFASRASSSGEMLLARRWLSRLQSQATTASGGPRCRSVL